MKHYFEQNRAFLLFLIFFLFLSCLFSKPYFLRPDVIFYYSTMRSLYFDRDLYFLDEYNHLDMDPQWYSLTPTGYPGNSPAAGVSILLYPFFIIGHIVTLIARMTGQDISHDGYSLYYRACIHTGARIYFLAGIILLYTMLKKMFNKNTVVLSLLLIWLFSPLVHQFTVTPTMAHLCSFFTVSLFIYIWFTGRNNRNLTHWMALGLSTGLMTLVRTHNILFTVILPIEFILVKENRNRLFSLSGISACMITFLLAVSPQMAIWKILYGNWISFVQGGLLQFRENNVHLALFSAYHGLFSWCPVLLVSLTGSVKAFQKNRILLIGLGSGCVLQLILIGFLSNWWADFSFGNRFFINTLPLFIFLLSAFLDGFSRRITVPLIILTCIWTSGLFISVLSGIIDLNLFYPYPLLISKWAGSFQAMGLFFSRVLIMFHGASCWISLILTIPATIAIIYCIHDNRDDTSGLCRLILTCGALAVLFMFFILIITTRENGQEKLLSQAELLSEYSDGNTYNFALNAMRKTLQYRILYFAGKHKFDMAIAQAELLRDKYSDDKGLYYLGYCYMQMGNSQKAMQYFQTYLSKHPDSVTALMNMGAVLAETGRYEEAEKYFKEVLLHDPGNEMAVKNLQLLEQARQKEER